MLGPEPISAWIFFNLFLLAMLALDLGVFHRKTHEVGIRESLIWTAVWIVLALVFGAGVWWWLGAEPASQFLAGYLIEKSLSVDNIFVFLLVFQYFAVPAQYQHKVLFWGILGALVFRFIFILAGVAIIQQFDWILYVFGVILLYSGWKLFGSQDVQVDPEANPVLKAFRKRFEVTKEFVGDKFWVKQAGKWVATPLFVVLLVVETTDIIFAVDSIPAILAISQDPFIVYTANAFAILGLRALYFALAGIMKLFRFLHYGLSIILMTIGVKMLVHGWIKLPTWWVLLGILAILAVSVIASILIPEKTDENTAD